MIVAGYMGAVSVVTTVKWFWFLFGMVISLLHLEAREVCWKDHVFAWRGSTAVVRDWGARSSRVPRWDENHGLEYF